MSKTQRPQSTENQPGADLLEARLRRRAQHLDAWLQRLVLGPNRGHMGWLLAAWSVALGARLTLLQAGESDWLVPNVLLVLGTAGLWIWGGRLFWSLCGLSLAFPLFFLRDWLTQSLILLVIAVSGSVGVSGARPGSGRVVLRTAGGVVVATYFIAAFHKLNSGFFDASVSCAADTCTQLGSFFPNLSASIPCDSVSVWLPYLAIVSEIGVGLLLALRPRFGIVAGLLFHIPLTLVFAPSFVFVMLVGYSALLGSTDRRRLLRLWRRRGVLLLFGAVGVSAGLWGLGGAIFEPMLASKTVALVFLASSGVGMWFGGGRKAENDTITFEVPHGSQEPGRLGRWVPRAALIVFLVNAATPYLGTQVQHTGAMLSNLRIDEGCWNHLLVPESVRRFDPYIRIDRATVNGDAESSLLTLLESRLWSSTALGQMRRNWCTNEALGIELEGSFLGQSMHIGNLCDLSEPLPSGPGVWGGAGWFEGYLRLQKRLTRACPQMCLH